MSRIPALTGERLIKALSKAGFSILRQRGSHVYLAHTDGRATVVPVHKGETIGRGLMKKIMRDTELSQAELLKLL
ncbi:MAG: type II toxin-antitoxin system HicA family toxin [Dehalogenimonas sp.]|uniref:Type II toxin-antitoxin system HicA family toxin n=1 Tax=Candidatus Dehalogenimonas loeffleri TaxID=3127115 RepID=A0ABZ2J1B5_9CHLR|nr:type II toxin-antitoxin system HicA family toxin [Dehalogenimonas sp.]